MTTPPTPLAAGARDLKARHSGLLRGEPSFVETTLQRAAVAALDEARDRLRAESPSRARAITEAQAMVDSGQVSLFEATFLVDVLEAEGK